MRTRTLWFILSLVMSSRIGATDKPKRDGKALIEEAEDRANIFALPSFEIQARVRIENQGMMLEGSYEFLWNGAEQWREELFIPGYSEIEVGAKGMVYLKRTTDVLQLRIQQLHRALGYGIAGTQNSSFVRMDPLPIEKITNIRDHTVKGVKLSCVEIEGQKISYPSYRKVCVNSSSGIPVRQEPYREETWMPVGTKMFPRGLSYVEKGKPLVDIQITEFKTSITFPPSTFEPPDGSTSRSGCMNPTPAYYQKIPNIPKYALPLVPPPLGAPVLIYALIGTDGVPQGVRVISGDGPSWNNALLAFVKNTQFAPATCKGHAVEVEIIEVEAFLD